MYNIYKIRLEDGKATDILRAGISLEDAEKRIERGLGGDNENYIDCFESGSEQDLKYNGDIKNV